MIYLLAYSRHGQPQTTLYCITKETAQGPDHSVGHVFIGSQIEVSEQLTSLHKMSEIYRT